MDELAYSTYRVLYPKQYAKLKEYRNAVENNPDLAWDLVSEVLRWGVEQGFIYQARWKKEPPEWIRENALNSSYVPSIESAVVLGASEAKPPKTIVKFLAAVTREVEEE